MALYEQLSPELTERIRQDIADGTRPSFAAKSSSAIRRDQSEDIESVWRPAYARDVDKIMHHPYYNRYTDKTQVFSFYKNDDIMYGIEVITGSKFVILTSDDELYYIGNFHDDKGLYFSNETYKYSYYGLKYASKYDTKYDTKYDCDDDWYKYDEDYWYDKAYQEQNNIDDKEEYMIQLESNWYLDIYGNGDAVKVGDKEYWYDYDTLELFEWTNGEMKLIAVNPMIYDENYSEVW